MTRLRPATGYVIAVDPPADDAPGGGLVLPASAQGPRKAVVIDSGTDAQERLLREIFTSLDLTPTFPRGTTIFFRRGCEHELHRATELAVDGARGRAPATHYETMLVVPMNCIVAYELPEGHDD